MALSHISELSVKAKEQASYSVSDIYKSILTIDVTGEDAIHTLLKGLNLVNELNACSSELDHCREV